MSLLKDFYATSVGKKIVMASTGLVLFMFVVGHMIGNLKMYAGVDPATGKYKLDHYAEYLRSIGADLIGQETFLWITRAVLLACLILHVASAIQLSALNKKAKPVKPQRQWFGSSNAASRTMVFGGLFLFCFIVFHILHLTTGTVHFRGFVHGAVYSNVFLGFQSICVSLFYILAMAFLSMHLYHGTWSLFQTLGVDTPAWNCGIKTFAKVIAIVLFIGFTALPIGVNLNLLPPPASISLHSSPGGK